MPLPLALNHPTTRDALRAPIRVGACSGPRVWVVEVEASLVDGWEGDQWVGGGVDEGVAVVVELSGVRGEGGFSGAGAWEAGAGVEVVAVVVVWGGVELLG